jgi:site-specific DNA recombinase
LDNSPEGQLIGFVNGYAAQIEREKIRERTVRGKLARAAQGKLPEGTGKGAYGYRYESETGRRELLSSRRVS